MSSKSLPLPLIALALSAFAIGTTEFVIMGLLPQVAANLSVSIPAAGWLVSGYALGVFFGAPIMAIITQSLPHRMALMVLMGIFILGNGLCAAAPSYDFLMAARIVTALCHGAFFGIGSVEAASLGPANKRTSAVAVMFTGLTLANVLGVPLGTALGQFAGWRTTFWAVAGIGVIALIGLFVLLPQQEHVEKPTGMARELAALRGPIWLALAITVLASTAMFTLFTYIAPILNDVTHISPRGVTYTLFLVGVGLTLGNIIGGKLADWKLSATLIGLFIIMAAMLVLFSFTSHYFIATEFTLFIWATLGFAAVPALQINVVNFAGSAPNLISTLNIAAFNGGNALGAWVGGEVISRGLGLPAVPMAGALLAFAALLVTFLSLLPPRGAH